MMTILMLPWLVNIKRHILCKPKHDNDLIGCTLNSTKETNISGTARDSNFQLFNIFYLIWSVSENKLDTSSLLQALSSTHILLLIVFIEYNGVLTQKTSVQTLCGCFFTDNFISRICPNGLMTSSFVNACATSEHINIIEITSTKSERVL